MAERLVSPRLLFRFAAPVVYRKELWSNRGLQLAEKYRLMSFAALDDAPTFADLRMAWSEAGLALTLRVEGKRQRVWCRETRIEDSDGLQIWIDTRDTQNIHRASRFCHRFVFLPAGAGKQLAEPVADQLLIGRAREDAETRRAGSLQVRSEKRIDGYLLEAFIPANALTGFDPAEYPKLGFTYAVSDRELGEQTFSVGSEYPFATDPSLWGTLELVKD